MIGPYVHAIANREASLQLSAENYVPVAPVPRRVSIIGHFSALSILRVRFLHVCVGTVYVEKSDYPAVAATIERVPPR